MAKRDHAWFSSAFPPTLSTKTGTGGIYLRNCLQLEELVLVCTKMCVNSDLSAEERLRKTVAIHYVNKMIQCVVEDSVQLLPSQSYSLDRRQGPCVQLCLHDKYKHLLHKSYNILVHVLMFHSQELSMV